MAWLYGRRRLAKVANTPMRENLIGFYPANRLQLHFYHAVLWTDGLPIQQWPELMVTLDLILPVILQKLCINVVAQHHSAIRNKVIFLESHW